MLYDLITSLEHWLPIAILLGAFIVCVQLFNMRRKRLGNKTLDERFWWTPLDAQSLFQALGPDRRNLYAITQVTLDLVFPPVYGTLLALLIVYLYTEPHARLLCWVPLLTAAADYLENFATAFLAWNYVEDRPLSVIWATVSRFAPYCTASKFLLLGTCLVLILVGGASWLLHPSPGG
jgi:hypothetical protein